MLLTSLWPAGVIQGYLGGSSTGGWISGTPRNWLNLASLPLSILLLVSSLRLACFTLRARRPGYTGLGLKACAIYLLCESFGARYTWNRILKPLRSGDSYTAIGYNSWAPSPSDENPLGVVYPGQLS